MKSTPSKAALIKRAFSLSFINLWRNKFLSLATIFVIGTIIFIFNIILAVNFIAKDSLAELSKKVDLVVYLKEDATFQDAQLLIKKITNLEGVDDAYYTSKEKALEQLKLTHPDLTVAFEKYELGNPLPASISITTVHPGYHKDVSEFLSQDKYAVYLTNISSNENSTVSSIIRSVEENLLKVTDFTNQITFWIIVIFILGGTLIILNAIQVTIYNRKQEIEVMKLVGARFWFIKLPFVLESVIYGILAIILSVTMLLILTNKIELKGLNIWRSFENINILQIILIELIAAIILSVSSSMIAVHEYLQRKSI